MIPSRPLVSFKITPINPDGVTYIDLGEMCQDAPAVACRRRHSSLPPSPTRAGYDHNSSAVRHGSLPPPEKPRKLKFVSPVEDSIEEIDEEVIDSDDGDDSESEGIAVIDSELQEPVAQNSNKHMLKDNIERDSVDTVHPVRRASDGKKLARSSANIKNVKDTKTCWFIVSNECAISKPHALHTSVMLELGDIFINQFFPEGHKGQALQVWVVVKTKGSNSLSWQQVLPNAKVYHPDLKDRILAFRPGGESTIPTWIKPNTDRPSRLMPLIVRG